MKINSEPDRRDGRSGMRLVRLLLNSLSLAYASFAFCGAPQTAVSGENREDLLLADSSNRPAYPLVIRIDHTALAPLEASSVDFHSGVDRVVLGTHAVGESRTRGAVSVLMVPNPNAASFDLSFRGRVHVCTVGTNGPALIYSHSDTDFLCTRRISFDPRQGFVSGARTFNADTRLVYDGFGSSRSRLGWRLISRIAERRASGLQEEARQIAARDTAHELQQGFDKQLDARLATMNKTANVAGLVKLLMVEGSSLQLSARSTEDCIYVGVGHEGGPARLTAIPPRCPMSTPIEISVYSTMFGAQVAKLLSVSRKDASPQLFRQEVLRALLIPKEEAAGIADVGIQEGWLVLGLQSPAPTSSTVRQWTDVTGKYHVAAAFVELSGDLVRLTKADGHRVNVDLDQLSAEDRQYIRLLQQGGRINSTSRNEPFSGH